MRYPREPRPPRWVTCAQEYVHARFREAPQLGEIARAVDVHPARLARAFRSQLGVSIGTYVRRLRLDWSRALPWTPSITVRGSAAW